MQSIDIVARKKGVKQDFINKIKYIHSDILGEGLPMYLSYSFWSTNAQCFIFKSMHTLI